MKKKIKNLMWILMFSILLAACGKQTAEDSGVREEATETQNAANLEIEGASYLMLSDSEITLDGNVVTTNTADDIYVANDIVYYEEGKDFTYGAGSESDAHSEEEGQKHTVVHITKPGIYVLNGTLSAGQIAVDLGEDAKDDPQAVVTLVLNNVDITCTVAPGVIFYNVYECSSSEEENAVKDVDTSAAGANVLIADGSVNKVTGSYVAKIYKSVELNEDKTEVTDSKKLHKYDGAFYSKMSMNVDGGEAGDGVLEIYAENEGLDSELHLTINGGNIKIVSGNDGINTNEDNVSVTTVNGGSLSICVEGYTGEGDGIDSNGWIVINGGTVTASACSDSMDAGIDADKGIYINGGNVIASGNMYDKVEEGNQDFVVLCFQERVKAGTEIVFRQEEEEVSFSMPNDFTYAVLSGAGVKEGTYSLWVDDKQVSVIAGEGSFEGPGMGAPVGELPEGMEDGKRPELPEGMENGERPELPEGVKDGERPEPPEGMEDGVRPELPEGMENGERPEPPEGMENGERPELPGGNPGVESWDLQEAVTEFELQKGSNFLRVVTQKIE